MMKFYKQLPLITFSGFCAIAIIMNYLNNQIIYIPTYKVYFILWKIVFYTFIALFFIILYVLKIALPLFETLKQRFATKKTPNWFIKFVIMLFALLGVPYGVTRWIDISLAYICHWTAHAQIDQSYPILTSSCGDGRYTDHELTVTVKLPDQHEIEFSAPKSPYCQTTLAQNYYVKQNFIAKGRSNILGVIVDSYTVT